MKSFHKFLKSFCLCVLTNNLLQPLLLLNLTQSVRANNEVDVNGWIGDPANWSPAFIRFSTLFKKIVNNFFGIPQLCRYSTTRFSGWRSTICKWQESTLVCGSVPRIQAENSYAIFCKNSLQKILLKSWSFCMLDFYCKPRYEKSLNVVFQVVKVKCSIWWVCFVLK